MNIIAFSLSYFLLHLIVQSSSAEYESVITTIDAVNQTFIWKINNFGIIDWSMIQSPRTVVSPLLKTRDDQKVNCSIIPFNTPQRIEELYLNGFQHRHIFYSIPKLICDFDPEPTAVKYSYINEDLKESGIFLIPIERTEFKDIEIVIDAYYSSTKFPALSAISDNSSDK